MLPSKTDASRNICAMFLTFPVFQLVRLRLKAFAFWNMPSIFSTRLVSQADMSRLNVVVPLNMLLISVTLAVFQREMSGFNAEFSKRLDKFVNSETSKSSMAGILVPSRINSARSNFGPSGFGYCLNMPSIAQPSQKQSKSNTESAFHSERSWSKLDASLNMHFILVTLPVFHFEIF